MLECTPPAHPPPTATSDDQPAALHRTTNSNSYALVNPTCVRLCRDGSSSHSYFSNTSGIAPPLPPPPSPGPPPPPPIPPTPPTPSPPKPANYQTASWVGSEYTPAAASNELWWAFWDDYKDAVRIELSAAQQVLGLTTVRMFLHNMVYDQASNSCASCFFVY